MKKYFLAILIALFFSGCGAFTTQKNQPEKNIPIGKEKAATVPVDKSPAPADKSNAQPRTTLDIPENMRNLRAHLPILMFHYIEDVAPDSPDQLRYRLSFSPQKLEQFLVFFKENGIETLTFWDLKYIAEGRRQFPPKAVMLTFDDGYIDQYRNAFPLLKKYDARGVFFVISSKPDADPAYATWEQIKEMSENGQEIASHTVSHSDLTNLSAEKINGELAASKEAIENHIGKPAISLCYPSGKYDNLIIEIAKEHYLFARTTERGEYFDLQKRYTIPTVRISPEANVPLLKTLFK